MSFHIDFLSRFGPLGFSLVLCCYAVHADFNMPLRAYGQSSLVSMANGVAAALCSQSLAARYWSVALVERGFLIEKLLRFYCCKTPDQLQGSKPQTPKFLEQKLKHSPPGPDPKFLEKNIKILEIPWYF